MRLIDADALKKLMEEECCEECAICCYANSGDGCRCKLIDNAPTVADRTEEVLSLQNTIAKLVRGIAENAPTVELTEEQAIDKLHETGWLIRHDKEMTERPKGEWIHPYITDIACECSNCHLQMPITDYFNFCPNCGAEMLKGGVE